MYSCYIANCWICICIWMHTGCARGLGSDTVGIFLRWMPSCLTHINYPIGWVGSLDDIVAFITTCDMYSLTIAKVDVKLFSLKFEFLHTELCVEMHCSYSPEIKTLSHTWTGNKPAVFSLWQLAASVDDQECMLHPIWFMCLTMLQW